MTNAQIIKKAILKVQDAGWSGFKDGRQYFKEYEMEDGGKWTIPLEYTDEQINNYGRAVWSTIFSHDFAKAFWGEEFYQIHLAKMVLEEEPLKYFEKFL